MTRSDEMMLSVIRLLISYVVSNVVQDNKLKINIIDKIIIFLFVICR